MKMNSTKLSAFCDKVIEVGWLAAVIVTPLAFNVYASRVFEPNKLTVLRTVALVMAAVWMVKLIEEWASGNGDLGFTWRTPLVLPTLFMAAVYLISTALSVTPWVSLVGSYERQQGTFTTFSYVVIFLMILQGLRTRAQLDRLVAVIIVNSLPIALYGLIQHHGLDPLSWKRDLTSRVAANMGNPIFLSAYLVMIFPLTLGRVVEGFRAVLTREQANRANILRTGGYTFIAAVQLMAIWYTQSRGPLLALLVGSFFFFLLLALAWRSKWGAISVITIITLIALLVGFIVLVNIPGGPLQSLQSATGRLGRLGQIFSFARILYWQGMVDLILPHEPLQYPDGHSDPFNPIRPLVGYGPESLRVVYNRFRLPIHWRYEQAALSRAHNETFDALATTGLLGLAAYLFLFLSVFYYGLKWLGLLEAKRQRRQLLGLVLVFSLAGIVFSWWQVGLHFFGVALSIGIVAGLAIYLTTAALVFAIRMFTLSEESTLPPLHDHHLLIISLLAALVTHFVEINFGIVVTATRTTFWAYAGLLVVVGLNLVRVQPATQPAKRRRRIRRQKEAPSSPPPAQRTLPGWLWPTLGSAVLGGFILGTLAFSFVINPERLGDAKSILWHYLTTLYAQEGRTSYGILILVILTWLMAGIIFVSEMAGREGFKRRASDWLRISLLYLAVSLGWGLIFALLLAGRLAALPDTFSGPQTIQSALLFADCLASQITLYYSFVAFVLLAGGLALMRERRLPRTPVTAWGAVALVPLLVLAGYISVRYNLTPIQADVVHKQAASYDNEEEWEVMIAHYEHAIELAPREDWYYASLGRAYLEKTTSINDPAQQDQLFQMAEQGFIQAREINPLEITHSTNLAHLYYHWYDLASDPAQKERLGQQVNASYEIATTLSPNDAILWNEKGNVYLQLGRLEEAVEAYEHVVELFPLSHEIWHTLGSVYAQLGRLKEAVAAIQESLELAPEAEDAWNAHQTLATLYGQLGRPEDALSHAQMAWQLAPEEQKPALQDLIAQLQEARP